MKRKQELGKFIIGSLHFPLIAFTYTTTTTNNNNNDDDNDNNDNDTL